jgi:transcriptional regulator with XRE-family HTH domain
MVVGGRLKAIRESKKMSQGDIEHKTGLLRCYVSRVENGHTIPAVETLGKFARAMDVSMSQLFHDGDGKPEPLKLPTRPTLKLSRKDAVVIAHISAAVPRMSDRDKTILVNLARKMAAR